MDPVLGREVVKGQQHLAILDQTGNGGRVFGLKGFHKMVKGLVRLGLCLGHPDLMQHRLGFGMNRLGQIVQHIGGLMDPAALPTRRRIHFLQGRPEAQRPVAGGHLRLLG